MSGEPKARCPKYCREQNRSIVFPGSTFYTDGSRKCSRCGDIIPAPKPAHKATAKPWVEAT